MLSRRAAFSLFVAAGVVVTFGVKRLAPNSDTVIDEASNNDRLVSLLARQGFAAAKERRGVSTDIVATRGQCRLRARMQGATYGYGAFRYAAGSLPRPAYRYRGEWLQQFPRGRYEMLSRLQWLATRYGLKQGVEMPMLVAMSEPCDRGKIDFGPQLLSAKHL